MASKKINSKRNMRVLELKDFLKGKRFSNNVGIKLSVHTDPIDVGSFVYLSRVEVNQRWINDITESKLDTFRLKRIGYWIDCLSLKSSQGVRDRTISSHIKSAFRFIRFSENKGCEDLLKSKENAKNAYTKYYHYLMLQLRDDNISENHAAREQAHALLFVERCFDLPIEPILGGCPKINRTPTALLPDPKEIEIHDVSRNIEFLVSVFNSIFDFCIQEKHYPAALDICGKVRWIFPNKIWIKNASGYMPTNAPKVFDYENGNVLSFEELKSLVANSNRALYAVNLGNQQINNANMDLRCESRLRLAMQAHDAFVFLFIAVTGMNLAGVRDLRWGRDYEIEKESISIRSIKYRAGGKHCCFQIEAKFLPFFRKYLKLREFILGKRTVKHLFFHWQYGTKGIITPLTDSFSGHAAKRFNSEIDHSWSVICARDWRANKSAFYLKNANVLTAAKALQNSEATVRKHYINGNSNTTKDEFTVFFETGLILNRRESKLGGETPVGLCKDFGNPVTVSTQVQEADCATWEGCLGCANYACHADAKDVRKLLSAREVVLATKHLSVSLPDFGNYFGFFLSRIEDVIEAISSISSKHRKMVLSIKEDVVSGNYDDYWMSHYQMLLDIGVISEEN